MATSAEETLAAKSVDESAVAFLTTHATFRSSRIFAALQGQFEEALKKHDDGSAFFRIPITEKIISYEKALLWVAFLRTQIGCFKAPLSADAAIDLINQVYDLDAENQILVHTFPDEESSDDEEEESADEDDC